MPKLKAPSPSSSVKKQKLGVRPTQGGCARGDFFADLELLFQAAMLAENYAAALKAKELLGKARGYFTPQEAKNWDLATLTDEDLESMVMRVEETLVNDYEQ